MIQGALPLSKEFACTTTTLYDSMLGVSTAVDTNPDDVKALNAALLAERAARREYEARASGAEAMVAHLKLLLAKMKRDRFGASAERGRKLLDQLEMQLEELETTQRRMRRPPRPPSRTRRMCARSRAASRCARRCLRICRASASFCPARRVARAAAASWQSWARPSPRRWNRSRAPTR